MFSKRKSKDSGSESIENISEEAKGTVSYKNPLVCLFDFNEESSKAIKSAGFNTRISLLGSPILIPEGDRNRQQTLLLLKYDWPHNIHEYDIFVVDMDKVEPIPYKEDEHKRLYQTSEDASYFLVEGHQTVFDGRAISGKILRNELANITDRTYILITFVSQKQEFSYKLYGMSSNGYNSNVTVSSHDNYSFIGRGHHLKNIMGEEIDVCVVHNELNSLLVKCSHLMSYEATFRHPTHWKDNQQVPSEKFIPLMRNRNKDIISYVEFDKGCILFVFPQMGEKEKLLIPLLENILPAIHPEIFPESTLFSWKNEQDYWLPNHAELVVRKQELERKFQSQIDEIHTEIESNLSEFAFLHNLLSETDDALVKSVIQYLHWLGFGSVAEMDNDSSIKEEDIQVILDDGILIIECKGIGGTVVF